MLRSLWKYLAFSLVILLLAGIFLALCSNQPWPDELCASNTLFTSYSSAIKSLDPAVAYFSHEGSILDNIVETPLEYNYEERPYRLQPLLLTEIPTVEYYAADGKRLEGDPAIEQVTRAEYHLQLCPGIEYQPHPCFGAEPRTLKAEDFRVALARLADSRLASPIFSTFNSFLLGYQETAEAVKASVAAEEAARPGQNFERFPVLPDYREIPLPCFVPIDDLNFKLVLNRKYPQLLYWLAMHFFAPVPWEAMTYYHRQDVLERGEFFRTAPVGTGPFLMSSYDPNNQIVLERNPRWRLATNDTLERVVFKFERESVPIWLKFLQGYYDNGGIPNEMFEAAIDMNPGGQVELSPRLRDLQLVMNEAITSWIFYFGFNMLDGTVGGLSEQNRALRQAISIVLDYQEYIDIFQNGRGIPAQSIIPPGIFGHLEGEAGVNPVTDTWDGDLQRPVRRPLAEAQALMAKAGYPKGLTPEGKPLVLYLDHASSGLAGFKAEFQWLRQKFQLLGIQLEERPSDLNRWRDKIRQGNWQLIFNKGWLADYPDPENFLFLFCSDNATVKSGGRGANYVNYESSEYDVLFRQLETMPNDDQRLDLIQQALAVLRRDAPCCWGFTPSRLYLSHHWLKNYKPHGMAYNTLKYLSLDQAEREACQRRWNQPARLAIMLTLGGILLVMSLLLSCLRHRQ